MFSAISRRASRNGGPVLLTNSYGARSCLPPLRPSPLNVCNCRGFLIKETKIRNRSKMASITQKAMIGMTSIIIGGTCIYLLYEADYLQPLPPTKLRSQITAERRKRREVQQEVDAIVSQNAKELSALPFQKSQPASGDDSAWPIFMSQFESLTVLTESFQDIRWPSIPDSITDFVVPDWAKLMPGYVSKLQRELSMAPGSLADEIWQEAHDPYLNPEIVRPASVRVSEELCEEEKVFLEHRRQVTRTALARYLGLPDEQVHPDDVPCIAVVGSGGGLRALVAGTGSCLASKEAGLFDCVTYTAGLSGSSWLQALYHTSIGGLKMDKMVDHLKARIGTHIAAPLAALGALTSAPTNKFLLRGFVEKLKGDPKVEFGLVDIYGVLLAARLLVPKGELGVNEDDLKISNQKEHLKHGENPLPIYCAVRHQIPVIKGEQGEKLTQFISEGMKEKAKKESWFQWFEMTPYEFFCEEFGAGIPTWAVGRRFKGGEDIAQEDGLRAPEIRLPLLLGIFGSAFCATLSLYYKEIRPMLKELKGFGSIDEVIQGRNDDLSKVHPIDPASIPNPFFGMGSELPDTAPEEISKNEHIQLMDAGMSNNLPIYPLLRPGREVDIIITFDASADIKIENWLSVTDGYARQRGIKGWPIGAGWPKDADTAEKTAEQLDDAQAATAAEADGKIEAAKAEQQDHLDQVTHEKESKVQKETRERRDPGDLGYCTVWVGTTEEREHTDALTEPPSTAAAEEWQLMETNAGITVIYFPFLSNPKIENVDPVTSPYMSTWNFIYTPEEIDNVVELARANFEEGRERTRRTVRAVYERKKKIREERESAERREMFRRKMRLGIVGKTGEGDHFS